MFDKLNKTIKYGKYKINYKIKRKQLGILLELIKENTIITQRDEGEILFTTNNVNKLLEYLINNITNINKICNYKYTIEELRESKDENIQKSVKELIEILTKIIEQYKIVTLKKIVNLGDKIRETIDRANKIQELL